MTLPRRLFTASASSRRRSLARPPLERSLRLESLEDRRLLATVTVGNVTDVVNGNTTSISTLVASPGADGISLREAIVACDATAGPESIDFASSLFTGGARTIQLLLGQLFITGGSLTIQGPGSSLLTIVARDPTPASKTGDGSRAFLIDDNDTNSIRTVALSGLTISGGDVGLIDHAGAGGAIWSNQNLLLTGVVVINNTAQGSGGGVYHATLAYTSIIRSLKLVDSTIRGNTSAQGGGGGIYAIQETLNISGSAIRDNASFYGGGGLDVAGSVMLVDSTVTGNRTIKDGINGGGGGIYATVDVALTRSTISGNRTSGTGAYGGGIFAKTGNVILATSTVSQNSTAGHHAAGGGIFAGGNVTLTSSVVDSNRAGISDDYNQAIGGGIAARGAVLLMGSTVSGNEARNDRGGGILADGIVTLNQSTVSGNSAHTGGGIYAGSDVLLVQSTVSGNDANIFIGDFGSGGGIFAQGDVTITQSTITNNSATTGGGVVQSDTTFNFFSISGSIIANNTVTIGSAPDLRRGPGSAIALVTYSLITDTTEMGPFQGSGNIFGVNPLLGPLADNGGLTQTHALLAGSPAINAGNPAFNPANPDGNPATNDAMPYDQRGASYARVVSGRIDIGAFEVQTQSASADFDGNGRVDGADFLRWQRGFGSTGTAATRSNGNANGDNIVNAADLAIWQSQYGTTSANQSALTAATSESLVAALLSFPSSQEGAWGGVNDRDTVQSRASTIVEQLSPTVDQKPPMPWSELIDAAIAYEQHYAAASRPLFRLKHRSK